MKQGIIDFIMGTLCFHQIPDWDTESAKNFCKFILEEEKIEYQEEDFHIHSINGDTNVIETVKQYAEKYRDIHKANDSKKIMEMNRVILRCDAIINFTKSIDDIFSDKSANMEPEQEITIKPGESIRFSNGAASNLSTQELTNLMKITYPEEQKENEEPFTILFNNNIPKEIQEEVLRRVSTIYEEVSTEIGRGNGR